MHVAGMSGVAVVRRGGGTVAVRAGGMADRDLGLACTPETRFQIASVSKQFTAAAVLLLASQSRLSLDDPVSRWLGGCPQDWQAITVHHLLTHTSGLGHLDDFPALDLYRPIEPARLREAMLTPHALPLAVLAVSPPGREGWSFTGYGYGWQIGTVAGRRAYFHTGDNPGYFAVNAWLPDEQITLAVLSNDQATDIFQAVTDILELAA
jgi:CubicO group peptidase (beta-lactamase class C family)